MKLSRDRPEWSLGTRSTLRPFWHSKRLLLNVPNVAAAGQSNAAHAAMNTNVMIAKGLEKSMPTDDYQRELLYQCVRELSYVKSVENCNSGLCATSLGADLVKRGMELLGVTDLSRETLAEAECPATVTLRDKLCEVSDRYGIPIQEQAAITRLLWDAFAETERKAKGATK